MVAGRRHTPTFTASNSTPPAQLIARAVLQACALYPVIEGRTHDLLLVHGEVTDEHCDIFDQEKAFMTVLCYPSYAIPGSQGRIQHITTAEAVEFVDTPAIKWPPPSPCHSITVTTCW